MSESVRVVVAATTVGELDPVTSSELIAQAWMARAPQVQVLTRPMSSGGPGFVRAVGAAAGMQEQLLVHQGELVTVAIGPDGAAYVDADALLRRAASSYDLGVLLHQLLGDGAPTVVVGVSGAGGRDGGLGLLQGLAGRPDWPQESDLTWLPALRDRLAQTPLLGAVDDLPPLLGFHGAAVSIEPDRARAQELESALGEYVDRVRRVLPTVRDLLNGAERRLDREPGAGAGGGLGYGLLVAGGRLRPGAEVLAELNGLDEAVAGANLVVTAETELGWRSLEHSVLSVLAHRASSRARPLVVLAREQQIGRREAMSLGVAATYSIMAPGRLTRDQGAEDVAASLAALTRRVAGTWTPTRG